MPSFNELFQTALSKLVNSKPVSTVRSAGQNVLQSAKQGYAQWQAKPYNQLVKNIGSTISQKVESAIPGGYEGAKQRLSQTKPIQYSPFGFINEAPRNASVLFGKNADIAEHGLRGMIDPIGLANKTTQYLNPSYNQLFQPTTQREKTARKVGQSISGTIATAPLGGPNMAVNVGRRAIQGTLLGTGMGLAGNALSGNPLTQDLDKSALQGLSNSWQLSVTNLIADKIGSFIPKLKGTTSGQLDLTGQLLKNQAKMGADTKALLTKTAKDLFLRAMVETGTETTWFSAFDEEDKRKFLEKWWSNLPGNFLGNVFFGSLAFTKRASIDANPQLIMDAKIAFQKTMKNMFGGSQYSQRGGVDPKYVFGEEKLPWEKQDPNSPKRNRKEPFTAKRGAGSYSQDPTVDNPLLKQAKQESYKFDDRADIDRIVTLGELHEYEVGKKPIKQLINRILKPLNNAPDNIKEMMTEWNTKLMKGKVKANVLAKDFSNIDAETGWKLTQYMQDPTPANARKLKFDVEKYAPDIKKTRKLLDFYYDQAQKNGVDLGYRKDYMPQVWEETPGQIDAKVRGLGTKPAFAQERRIPNYQEGLELGLTPRYTHPGQLLADYRYKLSKSVANKRLMAKLLDTGYLVPSSEAPADWKQIEAPYLPKATMTMADREIVSNYSAPPSIADSLNSIFTNDKSGLGELVEMTAKLSSKIQEVRLTGGIGPLNSFTVGQMIKEVYAGRLKSPLTSFVRAWSPKQTDQYFNDNQKYLIRMASEGVTPRVQDYQTMYENVVNSPTLKEKFGEFWENAFNKATFKRFMPMLELNLFKDEFDSAVRSGMSEKEASKLAGETTKAWFGMVDKLSRPKVTDDVISTFFFAPTFRQAMGQFWINNVKGVLKITDPKYKYNRRHLVGLAIAYGLMNQLNKKLTGHSMKDNKSGKKLSLEIPKGDNTSIYIPLGPSVMTLPRTAFEMGSAMAKGDLKTAGQQGGRFFSTGINLGADVASGKTWYGGNIYEDDDTAGQKWGKVAGYTAEQMLPGYFSNMISVMQGRKTLAEGFLGAMELPVYPSRSSVYIRKDYKDDFAKLVEAGEDKNKVRNFIAYEQELDDLSSVKFKKMAHQLIAEGEPTDKVLEYVQWLSDMDKLDKKLKKISEDDDLTHAEKVKKAKPIITKLKKLEQQRGN